MNSLRAGREPRNSRFVSAILSNAIAAYAEVEARADREWRLPAAMFNALVSEPVAIRRGLSYGPHERQKLDIFRPTPEFDRRTVAIFFYGGGWRRGERATYHFVGAALAARGFTVVIPDYRLFPQFGFPAFMEDAALAYRFVQERLNREKRKVALMGHSAGAHIATLLTLDARYLVDLPPPAAVVGLAGPYSFDPTAYPRTRPIFRAAAEHPDEARPAAFASAASPPMFLARGVKDRVVGAANADDLARALRGHGVFVENRLYAGIGHAGLILSFARPFRRRAPALADCIDFIERRTRGSKKVMAPD